MVARCWANAVLAILGFVFILEFYRVNESFLQNTRCNAGNSKVIVLKRNRSEILGKLDANVLYISELVLIVIMVNE